MVGYRDRRDEDMMDGYVRAHASLSIYKKAPDLDMKYLCLTSNLIYNKLMQNYYCVLNIYF